MPRAKRYLVEGHTYHLTHRCHNRDFLLQFVRDRDVFRKWLREGATRYAVPIYGYCVTSNHVHLVVHVGDREAVGQLMNLVAGVTGRQYNRRKSRSGSFWEDSYHCTAIQNGLHLWRCLCYVDMNMVRAGKVVHPSEWRWCGFDELVGKRTRYTVLDLPRLMQSLGGIDLGDFQRAYERRVAEKMASHTDRRREAPWTDAIAVGSPAYTKSIATHSGRRRLTYGSMPDDPTGHAWYVKEVAEDDYGHSGGPISG